MNAACAYSPGARPRGFVALISVVILSIVLLAAVTGASMTSLAARENALNDAQYAQARESSMACAHAARLMLASDRAYAGMETRTIGKSHCFIGVVTQDAGAYRFTTESTEGPSGEALAITLASANLSILRQAEIPPAPP